jgi:hypothetical protein
MDGWIYHPVDEHGACLPACLPVCVCVCPSVRPPFRPCVRVRACTSTCRLSPITPPACFPVSLSTPSAKPNAQTNKPHHTTPQNPNPPHNIQTLTRSGVVPNQLDDWYSTQVHTHKRPGRCETAFPFPPPPPELSSPPPPAASSFLFSFLPCLHRHVPKPIPHRHPQM